MKRYRITVLLLKLSIVSVFLYAAIAATFQPNNWIGYFPPILTKLFPANLLLIGFSVYQIILALWILSGKFLFYSSLLASLTILAIIGANYQYTDILFRDFAILFAALALTAFSKEW